MILCIFGSRSVRDELATWTAIVEGIRVIGIAREDIEYVLDGGAKGADRIGRHWAIDSGLKTFTENAKWKDLNAPGAVIRKSDFGKYNMKAGIDRNVKMAKMASHFVGLRMSGKSSGTDHMIETIGLLHKPLAVMHLS